MKQFGKLLCLLLTLLMVLSLTTTAFAEEVKGSITVDNPKAEETYTAYKIFDVTYVAPEAPADTPEKYSYTIDKDATNSWFSDVIGYMGGKEWDETNNTYTGSDAVADATTGVYTGKGITLTPSASDSSLYVVTVTTGSNPGTNFSAPDFAKYLKNCTGSKTGTPLDANTHKAENLKLGYYFVTSSTGALCNLTTTNPNVTISDKNDIPFEKVDDKDSVEIGEKVTYTITGKVPDTTGFTTYNYVVTDKMSDGLTYDKDSIKIYISDNNTYEVGDTELGSTYYTLTEKDGTNSPTEDSTTNPVDFRIDFKPIEMNAATPTSMHGKYILITYTATVNEKAVAVISNNNAKLEYSNNPTDNTSYGTRTDSETVYTAKIEIDKYAIDPGNEDDTSTKLNGAKFKLYKVTTEGDGSGQTAGTKLYYKYNETAKKVDWITDAAQATEVTTAQYTPTSGAAIDGYAEFKGLKDGTYYLLETVAPTGYNLLDTPVEVTIDGTPESSTEIDTTKLTVKTEVGNNTGAELPGTGGMGTTLFYIFGSILVVCAGVLLVTRKRMSAQG